MAHKLDLEELVKKIINHHVETRNAKQLRNLQKILDLCLYVTVARGSMKAPRYEE